MKQNGLRAILPSTRARKQNRPFAPDSIEFYGLAIETHTFIQVPSLAESERLSLKPSDAVLRMLEDGSACQKRGELESAARSFIGAAKYAVESRDPAGQGRALAQLAVLEEARGEVEEAFGHNRAAQEVFLSIGDGAALVQSFRVDAFLHIRRREYTAAAHSFAKALSLSIQLDGGLVMTTLDQMVPAVRHMVDTDQVSALLPLGAAISQALESTGTKQMPDLEEFSELAQTLAGVLAPLGLMASEPDLSDSNRRQLAARSTHQAWLIDALTRQRWGLAALVKMTLQTRLSFHEELD